MGAEILGSENGQGYLAVVLEVLQAGAVVIHAQC